jgi:flavin prenyltransferase
MHYKIIVFILHNNFNMHKIIIAITGASGSIYAQQTIEACLAAKDALSEIAIVMSKNAKDVWQHELDNDQYNNYGLKIYEPNDFMAPFASGSANFGTMIVAPCSMGTLARIANGQSDSLITRAADVILKERRKLICLVRETPYNLIHIKNMEAVTLAGGIICPATPSFYSKPKTLEDATKTVVDRVLNLANIPNNGYVWGQ